MLDKYLEISDGDLFYDVIVFLREKLKNSEFIKNDYFFLIFYFYVNFKK